MKGATQVDALVGYCIRISIHAPVKGATVTIVIPFLEQVDFNPRTREGCDVNIITKTPKVTDFNPRTREGCDVVLEIVGITLDIISIHAPVKGAT